VTNNRLNKPNHLFAWMLVLWVVVGMGCNDEAAIVNPSDFKIYVNNVQDVDVFPSEVISIGDHELLIFGICGNSPANKFEGDSSIYLRKIDQTGKTQWDTCYTIPGGLGFPSNLIKVNDQTVFTFWNRVVGQSQEYLQFTFNDKGVTSVEMSQGGISCNFECGAVMFAEPILNENSFNLLGIGFDPVTNQSTTYLSKFNPLTGSNDARSQKTFISEIFGGVGINDINLFRKLNNFLFLSEIEGRLLFSGPLGEDMILSHIGELIPIYQDDLFWVSAVEQLTSSQVALVLSSPDRPENPSYLIPEINLNTLPSKSNFELITARNQSIEIFDLDVDANIFIDQVLDSGEILIAGTSRKGQPIVYIFDGISLRSKEFGDVTRFELGAITTSGDGTELILVGSTKIENRRQRIFIIETPMEEILR